MADSKFAPRRAVSSPRSSPPNCAICLGACSNKCYSDSCMHEFCFKCLLEWSKIKAECPLCKQTFKSIIHNIKSLEEYDEHIVENSITVEENHYNMEANNIMQFLASPPPLTALHHQYHFRTTLTVDTHGEHAIQQMLLSHPLLLGAYPQRFQRRRRGETSSTFRRIVYEQNLWVYSPPDITGRYREATPDYFRRNQTARHRLVPWLNRELNVLLDDNTQQVMILVDRILDNLVRIHICSASFRMILREYLEDKTDHFIHEFYNFMRSPLDMIGYDRHVIYTERPQSPLPDVDIVPHIDISDNDSDVVLVNSTMSPANNNNNNDPSLQDGGPVIDLVETDSDEPILISEEQNLSYDNHTNAAAGSSGPSTSSGITNTTRRLTAAVKKRENIYDDDTSTLSDDSDNDDVINSAAGASAELAGDHHQAGQLNREKRCLLPIKMRFKNTKSGLAAASEFLDDSARASPNNNNDNNDSDNGRRLSWSPRRNSGGRRSKIHSGRSLQIIRRQLREAKRKYTATALAALAANSGGPSGSRFRPLLQMELDNSTTTTPEASADSDPNFSDSSTSTSSMSSSSGSEYRRNHRKKLKKAPSAVQSRKKKSRRTATKKDKRSVSSNNNHQSTTPQPSTSSNNNNNSRKKDQKTKSSSHKNRSSRKTGAKKHRSSRNDSKSRSVTARGDSSSDSDSDSGRGFSRSADRDSDVPLSKLAADCSTANNRRKRKFETLKKFAKRCKKQEEIPTEISKNIPKNDGDVAGSNRNSPENITVSSTSSSSTNSPLMNFYAPPSAAGYVEPNSAPQPPLIMQVPRDNSEPTACTQNSTTTSFATSTNNTNSVGDISGNFVVGDGGSVANSTVPSGLYHLPLGSSGGGVWPQFLEHGQINNSNNGSSNLYAVDSFSHLPPHFNTATATTISTSGGGYHSNNIPTPSTFVDRHGNPRQHHFSNNNNNMVDNDCYSFPAINVACHGNQPMSTTISITQRNNSNNNNDTFPPPIVSAGGSIAQNYVPNFYVSNNTNNNGSSDSQSGNIRRNMYEEFKAEMRAAAVVNAPSARSEAAVGQYFDRWIMPGVFENDSARERQLQNDEQKRQREQQQQQQQQQDKDDRFSLQISDDDDDNKNSCLSSCSDSSAYKDYNKPNVKSRVQKPQQQQQDDSVLSSAAESAKFGGNSVEISDKKSRKCSSQTDKKTSGTAKKSSKSARAHSANDKNNKNNSDDDVKVKTECQQSDSDRLGGASKDSAIISATSTSASGTSKSTAAVPSSSASTSRLRTVLKKEGSGFWYSRPRAADDDSGDDSDYQIVCH